jgi:hypothetical protein
MNIKECVLDNRNCRNIILRADEITRGTYFKYEGNELLDINSLLNKKVKTSERIGNELIIITYYLYR